MQSIFIVHNLFIFRGPSVFKQRSVVSRRTILSANGSVKSSKTYISKLEHQIKNEKVAREHLEKELQEIRKINSEITSKLGIKTQQK